MPQRASRTRKIFGGPQGEDAYVVYRMETLEEQDARQQLAGDTSIPIAERESRSRTMLCDLLIEWNWVNDENQPLPQPHKNPEVFKLLLQDEAGWILMMTAGQTDEQKKLKQR